MPAEYRRRTARYRGDPCGAPATFAIIWPISAGWCARAIGSRATRMSYADLAAAAHLSAADYLGDVPWDEDEAAKTWYAQIKSRPSFRPLLAETLRRNPAVAKLRGPRLLSDPSALKSGAGASRAAAWLRRHRHHAARFDSARGGATASSSSLTAPTATWTGWRRPPSAAAIRARCGRRCAPSSCSALNYGPDDDPLAILRRARPRRHLGLRPGRRLPRPDQAAAQGARALARRTSRRRRQGVRRHRGRDGEAARRKRPAWAGRASTPIWSRASIRLVAVPRRDLHHARPAARSLPRPTTAAPAAPASTSARRPPSPRPIGSMRAAASPISPSSTRARSRANCARPSATASMAATIAWRSVRGTSSRAPAARCEAGGARRRCTPPALAELARLDDAAFRALFAKSPVKRIGRDRFVRNVLIAIGNSGDATLAAEAERLLDDASPLVRGAAVWALSRLDPAGTARCAGRGAAAAGNRCRLSQTNGRRRSGRPRLDAHAPLFRARLLRPALRRRIRRPLRPHRRHRAQRKNAPLTCGRGLIGGRSVEALRFDGYVAATRGRHRAGGCAA